MNKYMKLAVEQAKIAYENNEVPIGAVIVNNGEVVSACYNRKNIDNISIYHAEILCIIEACRKLNSWYLNDCDIYVTLKPCKMCLYALAESRINSIYYLLDSEYNQNLDKNLFGVDLKLISDEYNYESMLKSFFKNIR